MTHKLIQVWETDESLFQENEEAQDRRAQSCLVLFLGQEEERADKMISALYDYYKKNTAELPEFFIKRLDVDDVDTVLCDFISGYSDTFAIKTFSQLFVPNKWSL